MRPHKDASAEKPSLLGSLFEQGRTWSGAPGGASRGPGLARAGTGRRRSPRMSTDATIPPPDDVLAAWGRLGADVRPFGSGLINKTFLVRTDGQADLVVQRLHPIFGPQVNDDIEAVTASMLVQPAGLRVSLGPRVGRRRAATAFSWG